MSESPDIAVLHAPASARAIPLLRVFISGFASRHDLSVDRIDDLQLAIETLVAEETGGEGALGLEISSVDDGLSLRLEGLRNRGVKAALLAADPFQPCENCLLDVRILLDSLVDGYRVRDMAGGLFALEMDKRAS